MVWKVLYVVVSADRMQSGHSLNHMDKKFYALQQSNAWNITQTVTNKLRPLLKQDFSIEEKLFMTIPIAGMRTPTDLENVSKMELKQNIDEVIEIIRNSYDDAKERLMERFKLSEIQAQSILDMRLKTLSGLQREKIDEEYNELMKLIEHLRAVLASEKLVYDIIKEELLEINSYDQLRFDENKILIKEKRNG